MPEEKSGAGNDAVMQAIADTYHQIDDNFEALLAKCTTDEQRKQLRALHSSARDAFWKAVSSSLSDNNPVVQGFTADLNSTNQQIKRQLGDLQQVDQVLALAAEAVKLAAALTTLAAAA